MDPQFVITTAGLAAASVADPEGPHIRVTQFKVGTGYGYTPAQSDTVLHGSVLYEGAPTSFSFHSDDTTMFVCEIPPTAGPFDYGEIGLFLEDGTLFALAAYPTKRSKLNVSISGQPHLVRFNCLIKLEQSPAIFNVTTTTQMTLLEASSFALVTPPQYAPDGVNAIIVNTATHKTLLTKVSATEWNPVGWTHIADCTVTSVLSTTQIRSTDFGRFLGVTTSKSKLLLQDSLGNVRIVLSIGGAGPEVTLSEPISTTGGVGTVCKLYQYNDEFLNFLPAASAGNKLWTDFNVIWGAGGAFILGDGEGPGAILGPSWTLSADTSHYGWNQTPLSVPSTTAEPTRAQWIELQTALIAASKHVGYKSTSNLSEYFALPTDTISPYERFRQLSRYEEAIPEIRKRRFSPQKKSLEYALIGGRTKTYTASTPWEKLNYDLTYTFTSETAMRAFFVSGGYMEFTVRSTRSSYLGWMAYRMFSLLGPIRFKYDGVESMGPLRLKFRYGDGQIASYGPLGYLGIVPTRKRMFSYVMPLSGKEETGVGVGGQGRADEMMMVELYATRDASTSYIMKLELYVYQTLLDSSGVGSPTNPPFIIADSDPINASRITVTDDPDAAFGTSLISTASAFTGQRINAYAIYGRPKASLLTIPYPTAAYAGSSSWGVDNTAVPGTEGVAWAGALTNVEIF